MKYASFTRRTVILGAALSMALATAEAAAPKAVNDAPFGLQRRPMPTGEDLNTLLPLSVGGFKREPLPAGTKAKSDEDLNVTYRSGSDFVEVGFSIPETVEDAHEAIKVTREEAVASKVPLKGSKFSVGTEPSFFHAADFISWSRGRYFYYAKASSPAVLARFMTAFPY
jgi:hypothetical protein